MVDEQYRHSRITSKIIRCAMTVHSALGNGFQKVIYQKALAIELELMNLSFSREFEMPIFYREHQIGLRKVDFLVEKIVCVDLQVTPSFDNVHFTQAINYLELYNLEVGLLLNFGEPHLNFKRLTNKKFKPSQGQD